MRQDTPRHSSQSLRPEHAGLPPTEPGYPLHPEQEKHPEAAHAAHGHARAEKHGHEHDKHAGHSVEMFRRKFWLTLLLTVPTLIWGHMLPTLFGYAPLPGTAWVGPLFGTAVFFYGGWVFLQGAARELGERRPGMMTLIALAITVAFGFSAAVTLGYEGMPLWEELSTLVTIMLLGHWIEMRSISQAQGALKELAKLLPSTATRLTEAGTEEVPLSELREGDVVLVRPGASVPADGVVREGRSAVNEAMVTGESRPVEKAAGERVIAGTVNGDGSLRVVIEGTGEHTTLAGIMRLVEAAQQSRSRAQDLADRAAFFLTFVALFAAGLTLAAWLLLGATGSFAIERVVAVLVIACPHALGLAIPLVIALSTTLGARSGLLVRDRRGLEEARHINRVIFDKTGTLTLGELGVVGIVAAPGHSEGEVLSLAAAVEGDSEHGIARGIVQLAEERGLAVPRARQFRALPGKGVAATIEGRELFMGGPALLRTLGVELDEELGAARRRAAGSGQAALYLVEEGRALALFVVADVVRPESREAIEGLRRAGVKVAMLTGDAQAVAEAVARELGIDEVFAEILPEDKADIVRSLMARGERVAMVGDGVNDAPALLTADVGIAIGAGTDVAVEAGDVVLVRSDPRGVPRILALSRATYRKMVQNLWWAAGYNIVALPLAAGVLAPWGFVLHPALAAIFMSASTVVVALNAQLLRRLRL